jgi:hypothetical protein
MSRGDADIPACKRTRRVPSEVLGEDDVPRPRLTDTSNATYSQPDAGRRGNSHRDAASGPRLLCVRDSEGGYLALTDLPERTRGQLQHCRYVRC